MTAPEKSYENCIRVACKQAIKEVEDNLLGTSTNRGEREWYNTFRNPRTGTIWYQYYYIAACGTFDCIGASLDICRAKRDLNFK